MTKPKKPKQKTEAAAATGEVPEAGTSAGGGLTDPQEYRVPSETFEGLIEELSEEEENLDGESDGNGRPHKESGHVPTAKRSAAYRVRCKEKNWDNVP